MLWRVFSSVDRWEALGLGLPAAFFMNFLCLFQLILAVMGRPGAVSSLLLLLRVIVVSSRLRVLVVGGLVSGWCMVMRRMPWSFGLW